MHLAYLDDSARHGALAIFGAVVVPHGTFGWAERMHSVAVEQVFPSGDIERFQEFHAHELFKGEGAFKGIPEPRRFNAIRVLLMALRDFRFPFVYGAVDERKLSHSQMALDLFEVANPLVAAFKLCLLGVEKWAQDQHARNNPSNAILVDYIDDYLFIADDTDDKELKKRLRYSFRLLRSQRPYVRGVSNRLYHSHDDMYFGDSRQSVGIQLADLCTYFMQRRLLLGTDTDGKEFYEMFAGQAICAKPEPEWTNYRELLPSHEDT